MYLLLKEKTMKNLIAIFVLLLFSCYLSSYYEKVTIKTTTENLKDSGWALLDNDISKTSKENRLKVTFGPATRQDFEKAGLQRTLAFKKSKNEAKKVNGTLVLKINGKWRALDKFTDMEINSLGNVSPKYTYLGKNDKIQKYLIGANIKGGSNEWYLIDSKTSEVNIFSSEPNISPTQKMFVTFPSRPSADNNTNGIHLWKVIESDNSSYFQDYVVAKNKDWIPIEIYWESGSSLIVKVMNKEKVSLLKSKTKESDFAFIRIIIKPRQMLNKA